MTWITWIIIASILIVGHELGHAAAMLWYGRLPDALVGRWWGIGLRWNIHGLSVRALRHTLWAGPLTEFGLGVIGYLGHPQHPAWILLATLDTAIQLIPWGFWPNDGTRLWRTRPLINPDVD
ncbi:hypothetical protein TPY_2643 [Sulfobacillus acidophilus TPY]|uniref:Peptidase M50 domain-containing protein n=1 Tax=Sulfobacillus acidophilus (strain ATCC 700253 / DSM 10332 / NAL) TaxID=679936 RepID=G8TV97_SULAD|nr:hypothetical protein TPY_2643 [Sulfobacillus acidophilus TPY]AEW04737.1 hypothetical protein Sulac_1237 [Sulfobacillus acidophilus DSM 10332]